LHVYIKKIIVNFFLCGACPFGKDFTEIGKILCRFPSFSSESLFVAVSQASPCKYDYKEICCWSCREGSVHSLQQLAGK
jgi:hypothetical protein